MRNIEEYAKDYAETKVNEEKETITINLRKIGLTIDTIADTLNVSKEFVEKVLYH